MNQARELRESAYAKRATGEPLTDDERAAVETARGLTFAESVARGGDPDVILGFLLCQAPELIGQFDGLVASAGGRIGVLGEVLAWRALSAYCGRGIAASMDDAGLLDVPSPIPVYLVAGGTCPALISADADNLIKVG